ncbi:hypothetical protein V1J52_05645 [Streptomyces sp. TRM 70351]|uniref:hypothetical protein n=1 Tax=Streptomyces sp. TRM 70351 TaxID=3116552 RepID=UPI002E7B9EF6|nr:hypothetical protein [Streptomyces sp. TRM 70351]MEE1927677.1 hypothetical protein [Streptomyces sp. TRM 70351]
MASLVWLLIPLGAAVTAGLWAVWAARQTVERGASDAAGVAGYDAFRTAMERSAAERYRTAPPAAAAPVSAPPTDRPGRPAEGAVP